MGFVHQPKPTDAFSQAQVASVGAAAAQYFVLTSTEEKIVHDWKIAEAAAGSALALDVTAQQVEDARGLSDDLPVASQPVVPAAYASAPNARNPSPIIFTKADVQGHFNKLQKVSNALAYAVDGVEIRR